MCRISLFIPKTGNAVNNAALIPFLNVIESNGSSNKDATGITKLSANPVTFKKAEEAVDLLVDGSLFEFLSDYKGESLLAHVRFATSGKGKKVDNNAHPFTFGNLTGVHNGHFSNYLEIKKKYSIPDEIEVDSAIFFYRLNMIVESHKETEISLTLEDIQQCVLEFQGNFALAIYDASVDRIWVLPHQNDLNLFDLGYAWMINTSSGLENILSYAENTLKFIFPNWKGGFVKKGEKIKNGFAFTIDGDGLKEIGQIKLPPKPVVETSVSYYHGAGYSPTSVSTKVVYSNLKDKEALIKKYSLSFRAFYDLLEELPGFGTYDSLTPADLKIIDSFLDWLKTAAFLDNIEEKCELWQKIYLVKCNEYQYAMKTVANFRKPFWLNSLEVIKSIPEPSEAEVYEV